MCLIEYESSGIFILTVLVIRDRYGCMKAAVFILTFLVIRDRYGCMEAAVFILTALVIRDRYVGFHHST